MKNENKVLACVDRSHFAEHVADYAAWAAQRMDAPLEFLHVIDQEHGAATGEDHSGTIGIDATEHLMEKLSADDEARTRLAREQGRVFLNGLRQRAIAAGADPVDVRQRHGQLEDTLAEQEKGVRLLVLGRRGASSASSQASLGSNVERTVRALNRPILTVTEGFRAPQRVLLAFDGGAASRRAVEMVAGSPLLRGLPIQLLMSGKSARPGDAQLDWARKALEAKGFAVEASVVPGEAGAVILQTVRERQIDLLVMGAFSHSPWHRMLFGSKTAEVLRAASVPTLLLR